MEKTISLLQRLKNSHYSSALSTITFNVGDQYSWNPNSRTITYLPEGATSDNATLLHEIGHALLDHRDFISAIDLINKEQQAWKKASAIADELGMPIPHGIKEDHLDSYREWLHARSLCPTCGATGIETGKNLFKCIACHTTWKTNMARLCALRRYKTT